LRVSRGMEQMDAHRANENNAGGFIEQAKIGLFVSAILCLCPLLHYESSNVIQAIMIHYPMFERHFIEFQPVKLRFRAITLFVT